MSQIFKFCPSCCSRRFHLTGNRYQCDNCQFTYFINAATAVAGIIKCGDELLFTVRAKAPGLGMYGLPGGFVDFNENLEQAMSRETEEELGVCIDDWEYLMSAHNTYDYANVIYHTCDAMFYTQFNSKPELRLQESEIASVRWIHKDNIVLNDIAFPSLQQAVKHVLDRDS